ncbi:MAG: HAD family hydrolase [Bryobacteraceae bacterium]
MLLIFDLDGTLIDSSEDLATATNATLENFGQVPLDPYLIYSYVGNGVPMLVRRAFGPHVSEESIRQAVAFFLTFYAAHATDRTCLYPGIREALDRLSADHTLAILTNKPAAVSREIVSFLGVEDYFVRLYGGDSLAHKKPDPVGIATLMAELGAAPEQSWMIGDSFVDIRAARNAGVRSCGVAWGFQPDSFAADPPDLLIRHPRELPGSNTGEFERR